MESVLVWGLIVLIAGLSVAERILSRGRRANQRESPPRAPRGQELGTSPVSRDGFIVEQGRTEDRGLPKLTIRSSDRIDPLLGLTMTGFWRIGARGDIAIGDDEFDREVAVWGTQDTAIALLGFQTRAAILAALRDGWTIEHSSISLVLPTDELDSHEVPPLIERALDLARRLSTPDNIPECLAHNAVHDPVAGVRRTNLAILRERFRDTPEARRAFVKAMEDAEPDIRLAGAVETGAAGVEVLQKLAADETLPWALRLEAFESLPPPQPCEFLLGVLRSARWAGGTDLRRAVVVALGRSGEPAAVEPLAGLLTHPEAELAEAAAAALGELGRQEAERALIAALDAPAREVRAAVCVALGKVGGVESVPAIRTLGNDNALDLGLRRAAAAAIAAIQARLVGAAPGQLAVADGDHGSLTIADTDGGAVELVESEQSDRARPASGTPGTRSSLRE